MSERVQRAQKTALLVCVAIVAAACVGYGLAWVITRNDQLERALADNAVLRSQLEAHNIEPAAGQPGSNGATGDKGDQGDQGPAGPRGFTGQPGSDGVDGTNGVDGAPGPPGQPGSDGATGPPGPQGPAGADGAPGADGMNGQDGQSAFPFTFTIPMPDGSLVVCTVSSPTDAQCSSSPATTTTTTGA